MSFLQLPGWGAVKPEWTSESLGFFDGSTLVGAGLVLYRQLPRLKRYLAYLPEGPVLDWTSNLVGDQLQALSRHVKARGAFAVRIGPTLVHRRWNTDTIKAAIADDAVTQLSRVPADHTDERATRLETLLGQWGWKAPQGSGGFAAGQPKFNFQLPLSHADGTHAPPRSCSRG